MNKFKSYSPSSSKGGHRTNRQIKQRRKLEKLKFPTLALLPTICHQIHPGFSTDQYQSMLKAWKDIVIRSVSCEGYVHGVKRYKSVRTYVFALIEGRNPEPPPYMARRGRLPVCTKELSPLIKEAWSGSKSAYQALNTLLYSSRILEKLSQGSYESITEGIDSLDPDLLERYRQFVRRKLKRNKIGGFTYELPVTLRNTSRGPNGKPRLESALTEARVLVQSPLWTPFSKLCQSLGFPELEKYLLAVGNCRMSSNGHKTFHLRKLVEVPDSDLKVRVVAISDYWTQTLLEALMPHLKFVLKRLFTKSTSFYDHISGFRKGAESKYRDRIMSYDMDSWTDRFHHDLQVVMMEELFGTDIAHAWKELVVTCEWYQQSQNKHVRYKQGQGMGTTGSFMIATIADHFFIEMVMSEHYKSRFRAATWYNKVGDDLWIVDPDGIIPLRYHQIGSVVNLSKSKVPTPNGAFMEYVSRVAWDGIDVSRISPKVINRASDWRYIPVLLSVASQAGVKIPADRLPSLSKRTKDGREYGALLATLLSTIKLTRVNGLQSYVNMDWPMLKELGYLEKSTLNLEDPEQVSKYLEARRYLLVERQLAELRKTASRLYGGSVDSFDSSSEVMEMAKLPFQSILDPESPAHQKLLQIQGVISYDRGDGLRVVHPKSLIAWTAFARSWIATYEDWYQTIYELDMEDLSPFFELESNNQFKDFKSFKEVKALENVIQINLSVFSRYDPEKNLYFVKTMNEFGFSPWIAENSLLTPVYLSNEEYREYVRKEQQESSPEQVVANQGALKKGPRHDTSGSPKNKIKGKTSKKNLRARKQSSSKKFPKV